MQPHRLRMRWWMAPVVGAVVAGHLMAPYLLSHLVGSVAIASGVLALVVAAKHRGLAAILIGPLYGPIRRRH